MDAETTQLEETRTYYRSLPTETLQLLRSAFLLDRESTYSDTPFCNSRLAIIERILRERIGGPDGEGT